ncbi:hypothetical protein PWT90_01411 [Aphanocladium album]|nr:hypothetical protein PWT90_01411 [Aphanocladium album]
MARDTTPLLAAVGSLPGSNIIQDHPPFLRASHSPWNWIPQRLLVKLRGLVVAYLTGTGIMTAYYKLTEFTDHPKWYLLFHFGVLSFILSHFWHLVTFAWTFTHLYYQTVDDVDGVEGWFIRLMSLPSNMGNLRKQFNFTMFYTTTTAFSFMNAISYWFVTRPHNPDATSTEGPYLLGEGWFKSFALFSLYTTPAIVMIVEILFFNSIKRPQALGAHLIGLSSLSGLYLGWATLGGHLTGCFPFYWLNPEFVGSNEAVAAYCMGFVGLAPLMFVLKQGFIGLREGLTNAPSRMREVVRETFMDN